MSLPRLRNAPGLRAVKTMRQCAAMQGQAQPLNPLR